MADGDSGIVVANGFRLKPVEVTGEMLIHSLMVVSVLIFPDYIEDRWMVDQLESFGVEVKTPVIR